MSTQNDNPAGPIARREIEIPATPEQVWQAIATGAGNAGWLFPAEIEEREGGAMLMHRAPFGGDAPATVTAYEPPHRFAYEEPMDAPGAPATPWATEFLIEGREGGTTVVRLVTGFDDGGEGWEDMVQGAAEGWEYALLMLRTYVTHFLGQPVVYVGATGDTGQPLDQRSQLSKELLAALNLTGVAAGDEVSAPSDAPPLAGVVEPCPACAAGTVAAAGIPSNAGDEHGYLLRTDEPGPGMFEVSTFSMNGQTVTVNVVGRLYGAKGAELATRDGSLWASWLKDRFPSVATPVVIP